MDAIEFYEKVVLQKVLIKENPLENTAHMMYGLTSEIMDELFRAEIEWNFDNMKEEIGDAEFFLIGLMHFYDIKVLSDEELFIKMKDFSESIKDSKMSYREKLEQNIGILSSIFKKELVSGVLKYEGEVLTKNDLAEIMYETHLCLLQIVIQAGYKMEEIRQIIAKKLNVRYKERYTPEEDLNRNVSKENKEAFK